MQRGRVRVHTLNLGQFSKTRYGENSCKEAGFSRVCMFFFFFLFVFFFFGGVGGVGGVVHNLRNWQIHAEG